LRSKVVDVSLGGIDVDTTGGAGGIYDREGAGVAMNTGDRGHDSGGGFVVRPGIDINALGDPHLTATASGCVDNLRCAKERSGGGLCKLASEFSEDQVLTALFNK
jgi:hypothetical protein